MKLRLKRRPPVKEPLEVVLLPWWTPALTADFTLSMRKRKKTRRPRTTTATWLHKG